MAALGGADSLASGARAGAPCSAASGFALLVEGAPAGLSGAAWRRAVATDGVSFFGSATELPTSRGEAPCGRAVGTGAPEPAAPGGATASSGTNDGGTEGLGIAGALSMPSAAASPRPANCQSTLAIAAIPAINSAPPIALHKRGVRHRPLGVAPGGTANLNGRWAATNARRRALATSSCRSASRSRSRWLDG